MKKMCVHSHLCTLLCAFICTHMCHASNNDSLVTTPEPKNYLEDSVYVKELFTKYGKDGVLTFEGFEHLLAKLGLASIVFDDHSLRDHRLVNEEFTDMHKQHNHVHISDLHKDDDHDHDHNDRHYLNDNQLQDDDDTHKDNVTSGSQCLSARELANISYFGANLGQNITVQDFVFLCPVLISQLDMNACGANRHVHLDSSQSALHSHGASPVTFIVSISPTVWGCSIAAVTVISLTGLASVVIIPIIQRRFYQHLLQFLVAMAVGTLTGDALLHLLPHAFQSSEADHSETEASDHAHSKESVWKGLVAFSGVYVFFIVERVVSIIATKRHANRKKKQKRSETEQHIGEKLSQHACGSCSDMRMIVHPSKGVKQMVTDAHKDWHVMNSIPCSRNSLGSPSHSTERINTTNPKYCKSGDCVAGDHLLKSPPSICTDGCMCKNSEIPQYTEILDFEAMDHAICVKLKSTGGLKNSNSIKSKENSPEHDVCLLSHHEQVHEHTTTTATTTTSHNFENGDAMQSQGHDHGHSHNHGHGHGHSHDVPNSVSAVAWMVIMGDGLHNFCDGMAIGAAFTTGLGGGLSTTVAVMCHELPHELGDFAMLLQAGMTVKQAIVYNLVSSVLCFLGMFLGILIGNISSASLWLFALTGGMFIYIALVDMLPELTAAYNGVGNPFQQLLVQNIGLMLGAGIMILIAMYEDLIVLVV